MFPAVKVGQLRLTARYIGSPFGRSHTARSGKCSAVAEMAYRLSTTHQRYRQTGETGQDRTGQTGQRPDSIGRTVLQTVAQKPQTTAGKDGKL